jgi:hypothetical protein
MVAGCLLASACGHVSSRAFDRMEADPDWVIVRGVPVVRQTSANDCGAAALAMVLTFWGQPTSLRDVTAVYPSAPDGGILAGHLRDFARTKNVSAFLIAGTVDDLGKGAGQRSSGPGRDRAGQPRQAVLPLPGGDRSESKRAARPDQRSRERPTRGALGRFRQHLGRRQATGAGDTTQNASDTLNGR